MCVYLCVPGTSSGLPSQGQLKAHADNDESCAAGPYSLHGHTSSEPAVYGVAVESKQGIIRNRLLNYYYYKMGKRAKGRSIFQTANIFVPNKQFTMT